MSRGRHRRYDDLQKRAAVDHFFDHGQCPARTVRQLGYPKSKELLASWADELEPGRRRKRAKAGSFTDDQKWEAVIAFASRKAPAQEVAGAVGVTRAVLYKWMTCVKISDTEAWGASRRSSSRRPWPGALAGARRVP